MKTPLLGYVVCFSLWAPLAHADAAATAATTTPSENVTMIADLRTPPPGIFQYGSWNGKVATTKSGLSVLGSKGAHGDGGFGADLPAALDFSHIAFVEVALGVVPGNEMPQVTVALNDSDGTQYSARLTIEQLVPGQPVWLRVRREDFRLNDVEKGSDSKMDWSKVTRWHLQGDWSQHPLHVIFVALRYRS